MFIFGLLGWIVYWLSGCIGASAGTDLVWPPAGTVTVTGEGLIPLLWLCAATVASGGAILCWARRWPRRSTLSALAAAVALIALFMLSVYRGFVAGGAMSAATNGVVFVFAGVSLRTALICGILLGVSALVLSVSRNRIAQGVLLGLSVLTIVVLTTAWGGFAWAGVCTA